MINTVDVVLIEAQVDDKPDDSYEYYCTYRFQQ